MNLEAGPSVEHWVGEPLTDDGFNGADEDPLIRHRGPISHPNPRGPRLYCSASTPGLPWLASLLRHLNSHFSILVKNWHLFFCVAIGLWAGLVIGYVTEYYTSNAYSPVQDVADASRTGVATNVIFGLALGYKSVIVRIFAIAMAIYVSFSLAAMYGITMVALGMLSTIATWLAIAVQQHPTIGGQGVGRAPRELVKVQVGLAL